MDGTETGWGRPAEPPPRWRALLDRARHGAPGTGDTDDAAPPQEQPAQIVQAPSSTPLPTRRPFQPLAAPRSPEPPPEQRPGLPPRRPVNPLDPRRSARALEGWNGVEARPPNPLDARRAGFLGRPAEAEAPHSFFNPPTRSTPAGPPPGAGPGYPPARAAASVGSAAVRPPASAPDHLHGAEHPRAPEHPRALEQPRPEEPPGSSERLRAPEPPRATEPPVAQAIAGAPVSPPAQAQLQARSPLAALGSLRPTSPAPSPARIEWRQASPEQETEHAAATLRRQLGAPRVIAFANPKGGVHKTTATVLAAATIGSVRGRGVLAWDDNELRGTLGLRAGSARHARTIRHLLADLPEIENLHGDALLQEIDGYLRHASDGSYDVLAGEENPRFAQRLDEATVRRVTDLLRRSHDVICVDTGNNVESTNWQTVMKTADQLVITTVPREDAAFTADWMLDLLDDTGRGELVAGAVTLISCPSPGPLPLLEDLKKHFSTRTRAVAVVPYDPALEVGSSIEYADLQPQTRTAWLRAAATMIEPFAA